VAALAAHCDRLLPEKREESWYYKEGFEYAHGLAATTVDLIYAIASGFVCWVADADVILDEDLSSDGEGWKLRPNPW
jgi:hypothetical protein